MTVTLHVSVRAWRPLIAARSSIRLLVVLVSPPCSTRSRCPYLRMHAHPPGPGLPRHDPSVKIVTPFMCSYLGRLLLGRCFTVGPPCAPVPSGPLRLCWQPSLRVFS